MTQVSDQESMKRLKRLMTIMDSMNDKVNIMTIDLNPYLNPACANAPFI